MRALTSEKATPMYGPAVRCKRFSSSWHSAVLHQCIRSLIGAGLLRTIMDISARAFSLTDRPQRAIWVTSVRMRREDRSPSLLILSQTSAGKAYQSGYVIADSSFFGLCCRWRRVGIKRIGSLPNRSSAPRMPGHGRGRSRRCGRACWRVRSPARCDAAASWPPRSRACAHGAPRS